MLAAPGAAGHLYVCGDAKAMARGVHRALLDIRRQHGDCTEAVAEATIKQLTHSGRYSRDVWGWMMHQRGVGSAVGCSCFHHTAWV
jgi:hypothetical protein